MRPPRIAILVLFFVACLFLLCRSITSIGRSSGPIVQAPASAQRSTFRSFFSFSTPFTLFPPNAIITIADDNSTSFAARPAAFGPPLPTKGLNGQIWIGSGFTEETLQDDEGEGELGCSDVPGWNDGSSNTALKASIKEIKGKSKASASKTKTQNQNQKRDRAGDSKGPMVVDRTSSSTDSDSKSKSQPVDDGTDDYLHEGFGQSHKFKGDRQSSSDHADIQSMQEGAEIAGKIVLLSRGGCGFLEKVKWAQRRGAIALIVGDNQRGGPLIQMFARGDTSNVTIPSIFTSRTTAYLLSLMMQPGSFIQDLLDENGKPSLQVQADKNRKKQKTTMTTNNAPKPTTTSKAKTVAAKKAPLTNEKPVDADTGGNWFTNMFSWDSSSKSADRSRPPSSGQHEWVLVEDFSDQNDKLIRNSLEKASTSGKSSGSTSSSQPSSGDGFQIGVQDWRDPDLVGSTSQKDKSQSSSNGNAKVSDTKSKSDSSSTAVKQDGKKSKDPNGPKGGSITPGSGEYAAESPVTGKTSSSSKTDMSDAKLKAESGLISKIFGGDSSSSPANSAPVPPIHSPIVEKPAPGHGTPPPEDREGLWIVITPSNGASPFFDTLLVLVISPLITLTVVYALLILRARIRRRRWRAPKSVVERLPVRTFHTVTAVSTPAHSPRCPSPPSPTTPLLQSQHGPPRPRPRSRTTTGVPVSSGGGDLLQVNSALQMSKSPSSREKTSEWKKYMGRQVECVVCLEEYVDGVSQVMSLPCGHEFHVECITPWLTTRRRTCPICKGDVVRSLARQRQRHHGSSLGGDSNIPVSPRYEPYRDDSDEDDFVASSSSSSRFASSSREERDDLLVEDREGADGGQYEDLEQGVTRPREQTGSWLGMLASSFRSVGTNTSRTRERNEAGQQDRDR